MDRWLTIPMSSMSNDDNNSGKWYFTTVFIIILKSRRAPQREDHLSYSFFLIFFPLNNPESRDYTYNQLCGIIFATTDQSCLLWVSTSVYVVVPAQDVPKCTQLACKTGYYH